MDNENLEYYLENFMQKYPVLKDYQEYHVFTLLCIKYFFFGDEGASFDIDNALGWLTDGGNDSGIDAVFNDPSSENNDMIIVQSKDYRKADLKTDDINASLTKISQIIDDLYGHKTKKYNENVVSALKNSLDNRHGDMEDDGRIRIVFFTSYQPKSKNKQNSLEKAMENSQYDTNIYFRDDILTQIDICDNVKQYVDYDKLKIDNKSNFLKYENSVIVNISAQSLQDLCIRRKNGLLEMNLRYYYEDKIVDNGIDETVENDPEDFWYKNNGILIICDDFKIEGDEIYLTNFSIVNGGQTTSRLGKVDIKKDFYLQCKVIKIKGISKDSKDNFAQKIAEATNSQKPIKSSDLKANSKEQKQLKKKFDFYNVYYITKKGDEKPKKGLKKYDKPYQGAKLEEIGRIGLAAVLQMPGSARSNSKIMYDDTYYDLLFGKEAKVGVYADLLRVSYYYKKFLKTYVNANAEGRSFDDKTEKPMLTYGERCQCACITFLCKIIYGVIKYGDIEKLINDQNINSLKIELRKMDGMEKLISAQLQDEESTFTEIFTIIGSDVLGYCYDNALQQAEDEGKKAVDASNYLKLDSNYYNKIIKRLWNRYAYEKSGLKKHIDLICGK